jgi:hypothetical protein
LLKINVFSGNTIVAMMDYRNLREFLDSQTHTDSRLDALVDIVQQNYGSGEEAT